MTLAGVEEEKGERVGTLDLLLIAVGLSMDAFAVAICKGLGMHRLNVRQALVIAAFFGGFQALMPALGWLLGAQFADIVAPVGRIIAFVLLAAIGGKMVYDAFHEDDPAAEEQGEPKLDLRELTLLAIATSIDAFAVGITFAILDAPIVSSAAAIGVTTFVLSFAGVAIGHQFGARWEKPSTIAGGVVLILIGVKTLLEYFGITIL